MVESGMRLDDSGTLSGSLNNMSGSLYETTGGRFGEPFLGCGEQADWVTEELRQQLYDDPSKFEVEGRLFPPHQWGRATSSNPNDPVI
jgi:hypothetical protein